MLAVQAELQLTLANSAILGKSNEELRAKLKQYSAA